MQIKLFILILVSLVLTSCVGTEDTSNKTQAATTQQQSHEIQLTGDWIKDAKVVDSNNQQAVYKGKGVYSFKSQPQGTITLTGGRFENTGLANKMPLRADASSKTLSTMDSFFHQYPHSKNKMLKALGSKGDNQKAHYNTEKIIYLMASNNLLNQFSNSLGNVKSYSDIVASARSSSSSSTNANAINLSLLMLSLSFFDINNSSHTDKVINSSKRYVTQNGRGRKNGASWEHAYEGAQLQQAINEVARAKGEVWVAKGIYKPSATDASVSFELKNGVKLYGGFEGDETTDNRTLASIQNHKTILSGDIDDNDRYKDDGLTKSYKYIEGANSNTVIKLENPDHSSADDNTTLDGFYITGGQSNDANKAAGLNLNKAKLILKRSYFYGNTNQAQTVTSKTSGGAIRSQSSFLGINNVHFEQNQAKYGAAIASKNSTLNIIVASFNSNKADYGGAILRNYDDTSGGHVSITNSTFKNNKANKGGAIYNIHTHTSIKNAAFINNFATESGGAIFNQRSSGSLMNISFYGNRVQRDDQTLSTHGTGGAIHNQDGSIPTIANATFAYNTNFSVNNNAEPKGGAIYNDNSAPRLINTTFYNNHVQNTNGGAMFTENNVSTGRPIFVNSILWDNEKASDKHQHKPQAITGTTPSNDVAITNADSLIETATPATPATSAPEFNKKTPTVAQVKHIVYSLISAQTENAKSPGSHTVGGVGINVPDKDQLGISRGTSAINKGAIETISTGSAVAARPFIKTFKESITGSQATVNIVFSENMKDDTGLISIKDENNAIPSGLTKEQDASNLTKFEIKFNVEPNKWYILSVKDTLQNDAGTQSLNRNYIYEFKAN